MTNTVFGLAPYTVVGLGGAVVLAALVVRYLRNRQLTKYHLPAIILLLLGITAAFGTVVGYELTHRDVYGVEYNVTAEQPPSEALSDTQEKAQKTSTTERSPLTTERAAGERMGNSTPTPTPPSFPTTTEREASGLRRGGPYEFDELSPDAQDVFLSALRSDGTYTTRTNPSEFQDGSDGAKYKKSYTFVHYNSTWYVITFDWDYHWGGLDILFVLLVGGTLTGITLTVGLAGMMLQNFKGPVSVLMGLGVSILLSVLVPYLFLPIFIGITLVTWFYLWVLETQLPESFRERMNTTDSR